MGAFAGRSCLSGLSFNVTPEVEKRLDYKATVLRAPGFQALYTFVGASLPSERASGTPKSQLQCPDAAGPASRIQAVFETFYASIFRLCISCCSN